MRKDKVIRTKNQGQMFYYIWFIVVVALLMMCLMWSVYLIPVEKIRENARPSADILDLTPRALWHEIKVPGRVVDKITDSRMLNEASFLGYGDALQEGLLNFETKHGTAWWGPTVLKISLSQDTLENLLIYDYARFWHGYLLFLKPLLVFFDLEGIRIINLVFQLGLLVAILCLMYKRLGFKHCVAFLGAMCFINPITSWMCLEYANVVNVMLIATLWVLLNKNSDDNYMFFVIGAVTILFDFITFPLVTLGIPLILYLCLYKRGFKEDIRCVIKNSLLWLIGYAGMWFSKWVLATLFTDYNVIKDGLENVLHRTYGYTIADSVNADDINILKSIKLNLEEFYSLISLYYFAAFIVVMVACHLFWQYKIKLKHGVFVLLGVGVMPFVWYSVLVNHSVIHAYLFTHKILAVSVYAILASVVVCLRPKKSLKTKI